MHLAYIFTVKPVLEHDCRVELFVEGRGRISAFARYAQGKKPRFGGRLQSLNLVDVVLFQRRSAPSIKELKLIEAYSQLKSSYSNVLVAYYFISVIRAMTQFEQPADELFSTFNQSMLELNMPNPDITKIKTAFYQRVLEHEGIYSNSAQLSDSGFTRLIQDYANVKVECPI